MRSFLILGEPAIVAVPDLASPQVLSLPSHPLVHKDCNKAWELISAKLTSLILSPSAGEASGTARAYSQNREEHEDRERDAKNPIHAVTTWVHQPLRQEHDLHQQFSTEFSSFLSHKSNCDLGSHGLILEKLHKLATTGTNSSSRRNST
ncbi:hypothetical protein YC2023_023152 [Brassica napus]|uniref:Uncharacterized protein n=1 Tax=Brassica campestris TaxID=3711 RepID=M4CV14_BRACM